MLEIYKECTFTSSSSFNWIGFLTLCVAAFALYIARTNLIALKRSHKVQSHMNLINLENEVRRNNVKLKESIQEHTNSTTQEELQNYDPKKIIQAKTNRENCFEIYVTSVDKLASLIGTDYLSKQFSNRNWKEEYHDFFKKVMVIYQDHTLEFQNSEYKIPNFEKLLEEWNKK